MFGVPISSLEILRVVSLDRSFSIFCFLFGYTRKRIVLHTSQLLFLGHDFSSFGNFFNSITFPYAIQIMISVLSAEERTSN